MKIKVEVKYRAISSTSINVQIIAYPKINKKQRVGSWKDWKRVPIFHSVRYKPGYKDKWGDHSWSFEALFTPKDCVDILHGECFGIDRDFHTVPEATEWTESILDEIRRQNKEITDDKILLQELEVQLPADHTVIC